MSKQLVDHLRVLKQTCTEIKLAASTMTSSENHKKAHAQMLTEVSDLFFALNAPSDLGARTQAQEAALTENVLTHALSLIKREIQRRDESLLAQFPLVAPAPQELREHSLITDSQNALCAFVDEFGCKLL